MLSAHFENEFLTIPGSEKGQAPEVRLWPSAWLERMSSDKGQQKTYKNVATLLDQGW